MLLLQFQFNDTNCGIQNPTIALYSAVSHNYTMTTEPWKIKTDDILMVRTTHLLIATHERLVN